MDKNSPFNYEISQKHLEGLNTINLNHDKFCHKPAAYLEVKEKKVSFSKIHCKFQYTIARSLNISLESQISPQKSSGYLKMI